MDSISASVYVPSSRPMSWNLAPVSEFSLQSSRVSEVLRPHAVALPTVYLSSIDLLFIRTF